MSAAWRGVSCAGGEPIDLPRRPRSRRRPGEFAGVGSVVVGVSVDYFECDLVREGHTMPVAERRASWAAANEPPEVPARQRPVTSGIPRT